MINISHRFWSEYYLCNMISKISRILVRRVRLIYTDSYLLLRKSVMPEKIVNATFP